MIGTSVGLGIAWTDSGWRDGGGGGGNQGDKIQQLLFEKLVERVHSKKKKKSLADSVPKRKSMPQPAKTENMSLHRQKDTRTAGQPLPIPVLFQPVTNTRGINKINR